MVNKPISHRKIVQKNTLHPGTRHANSMDYIDYAFKERVDRAMIDVKQV